ncbi:MAG: 30S ribosomal protein S17 [Pseudobacteriovorax sp.]|nr:30S ribosomal protein S17 [Pseudobacteriovorax sp.]
MSNNESNSNKSKPLLGVVTSDKMSKARVCTIERTVKHSRYDKYIRRRTKIMFHDENNQSKLGDSVLIIPSKPYSARKRFNLLKIVEVAKD